MAVNGTISIYRLTATPASDTETEVSDKIEFNGDHVVPDSLSFIQRIKPTMSIIGQENANPDSNEPNLIDDTGLAFVGIELWGYFVDTGGTRPVGYQYMRDWMKQPKTNTTFPFGRFGYRNNISDEFNIVPTASSGYVIEHFESEEDYGSELGKVPFYIKLRFQGDSTDLVA